MQEKKNFQEKQISSKKTTYAKLVILIKNKVYFKKCYLARFLIGELM
jgi:hypothetical protein